MPLIVTCLEDSGQSRCLADLHAASSEHPAPESRLTATPGAALTRTRGLRSSRDRLGGCGGTARKGGGQGLGRLTDILAVTPKDSSDEQRQQHQRLGSPEADHGSPRGPAGRAERREAARARRGCGSHRALMQEARGAGGGGRRPGSPAALCVFSPPRRPLYAPGPTGGW